MLSLLLRCDDDDQSRISARVFQFRKPISAGTANIAVTEAGDSIAASAKVKVTAAIAVTEINDSLASSLSTRRTANIAISEAGDSLVASVKVRVTCSIAIAESDDACTGLSNYQMPAVLVSSVSGISPFQLIGPSEELDFGFDWSAGGWLGDDTISSSEWTISAQGSGAPTAVSGGHNSTTTSVTVSGCEFGHEYRLQNMITTDGGRAGERELVLRCGRL